MAKIEVATRTSMGIERIEGVLTENTKLFSVFDSLSKYYSDNAIELAIRELAQLVRYEIRPVYVVGIREKDMLGVCFYEDLPVVDDTIEVHFR